MTLDRVNTSMVFYALHQDGTQPRECLELEYIPCIFCKALNLDISHKCGHRAQLGDKCQDNIARVLTHEPHAA
jgi:hypothetical protein